MDWKKIRLVSGHFSKGLLELLSDGLVLLLLRDQLILQPVHLEKKRLKRPLSKWKRKAHLLLQLLDGFLSKLSAGLGLLQLGAQGLDLLLVGLLPLVGLLLSHLDKKQVSYIWRTYSFMFTSRDFRLLATTLSSSSSSMILSSPTSARSSAFSRSPSQVASYCNQD